MAATIARCRPSGRDVSTATVSRVLAGLGPGATGDRGTRAGRGARARLPAVGRRPLAQAPARPRRSGLIVTDIENPYFPELVRAVEDAARAEGYAILLCNAADDPEREAGYLELLVERRVDGLIIAASSLGVRGTRSGWRRRRCPSS